MTYMEERVFFLKVYIAALLPGIPPIKLPKFIFKVGPGHPPTDPPIQPPTHPAELTRTTLPSLPTLAPSSLAD